MPSLAIAIVGAGIGGLTAALALAQQGHAVTLLERRTGFSELGAGLQLSPNASRVLIDLGLAAPLRRVATEPARLAIRSIPTGRTIGEAALGLSMRERFDAPYWLVHRADLQTILLDAVRSQPGVRLVMGRTLEALEREPNGVILTLATAGGAHEKVRADLAVAADGIWSRLRRIGGDPREPRFRGQVAWRTTIPREEAPRALAGNETGLWLGPRGHLVHYPIGPGGRQLNIVAIERRSQPVEGWSAPGDGSELVQALAPLAPPLRELLSRPTAWLLWSLLDLPARRMGEGRIALLGDAAHPVLPFLAQGAALAIEDAAVLALHLRAEVSDPARAVRAYAAARLRRVRRVQAHARRNGRLYHAGPLLAPARDWLIRRLGPDGMIARYAWLYGWAPARSS